MNHPSTSSTSGSVMDATFSNPWDGPGAEIGFTFPSMDHFHRWDHHSPPVSTSSSHAGGTADQALGPHTVPTSSRSNADMPRSGSFMLPFIVDHSHRYESDVIFLNNYVSTCHFVCLSFFLFVLVVGRVMRVLLRRNVWVVLVQFQQ